MTPEEKRLKGTVKWFSSKQAYGFIECEDKQGDIFFHISDVEESPYLEQNNKVEFEIAEGKEGKKKAIKVRRVK